MSDDPNEIAPMSEILERHGKLTVSELMDNMGPQDRDTMVILSEILVSMPHRHSLMLIALLFGTMAADAEMEHPERSFADRMSLFMVHAATGYREAIQFIKDNKIFNPPERVN